MMDCRLDSMSAISRGTAARRSQRLPGPCPWRPPFADPSPGRWRRSASAPRPAREVEDQSPGSWTAPPEEYVVGKGCECQQPEKRTEYLSHVPPPAVPGYSMPVSRRAASDIMLWFHGGSNTSSTSASTTVGTRSTLVRTSSTNTSPIPHPGAVSVIRMFTLR